MSKKSQQDQKRNQAFTNEDVVIMKKVDEKQKEINEKMRVRDAVKNGELNETLELTDIKDRQNKTDLQSPRGKIEE